MSGTKAALKAINDGIAKQDFDGVIQQARTLLDKDPKNYQAYVVHTYLTPRPFHQLTHNSCFASEQPNISRLCT